MSVFENYARYYDLLYADKPYREEADYVRRLIHSQIPDARSIVELGCGTGLHAEYLARDGMQVDAVDLSQWMLDRAVSRRENLPAELGQRLRFSRGDVRDVRLGVHADAVISLFHVMSYQSENKDVQAMFDTAREHLRDGGVFIFDVWYGPAVLAQRPAVRVRTLEDDAVRFIRIAEPVLYPERNLVDVHYRIVATDKATGRCIETDEVHRMRYLFSPEIEFFAAQAGFRVVDVHEWMTSRAPGFDTWGVCFVCRA
jgi:SAM-dependent methyltransferase